ncbi:MAG TPA: rhomboid family intramembrane serine protease, partial [Chitinophagaceae bacterium]|nr:rhomboid family intramembrane serine protease [Chitinophagaceae bacterium]
MFSITVTIIIITSVISFAAFNNRKITDDLIFWPAQAASRRQYYRFFTCGLIHADLMHLLFNMLSFYSIGEYAELRLFKSPHLFGESGKLMYLLLYISAIAVSVIPDYFKHRDNYSYRALGASGAVSAVVFAFILLEPSIKLYIFFIPVPVPAYLYGLVFLLLSLYLSRKGTGNIGHLAHFSGAIYGILFTIIAARLYSGFDVVAHF